MPIFESRTELHATSDQLFYFLVNTANLEKIAPPEMQFVFVNPPPVIQLGSPEFMSLLGNDGVV